METNPFAILIRIEVSLGIKSGRLESIVPTEFGTDRQIGILGWLFFIESTTEVTFLEQSTGEEDVSHDINFLTSVEFTEYPF